MLGGLAGERKYKHSNACAKQKLLTRDKQEKELNPVIKAN